MAHLKQTVPAVGNDGSGVDPRRSSTSSMAPLLSPSRLAERTHDGSVDMRGRPVIRSRTGSWKAAGFIIGVEMAERLAYYGIASNMIMYLTKLLREGNAPAAKNINNWMGVSLVIPIIGGFFADAYWGRYWTIAVVSMIYLLGMVLLTLAVSLRSLRPPPCNATTIVALNGCPKATSSQLAFFFASLYLVSIGTGGIKPCLEAFGADQFDEEDEEERQAKSSFFNWWYFGLCSGGLLAVTVLVYVQTNKSWGLGYGIPTAIMALACAVFFAGTPFYRHKLPGGSPLTQIARVLVAAVRNFHVKVPENAASLYEPSRDPSVPAAGRQLLHSNKLRFLDKAAVDTASLGARQSPWRLSSVTQVEEVKQLVRVLPVWVTTFAYGVVFAQSSTFFTKQVATMDTRLGRSSFKIPPASFQAFMTLTVLALLPLYEKVLVPAARRLTGNERGISMLQRIGVGLFFSVLCMVAAALSEERRLNAAKHYGLLDTPSKTIPQTAFWLLPQYIILGIADVFTLVGLQEFFYDQVPDSMRSLGMAFYLSSIGVGSFISSLIVTVVNSVSSHGGKERTWIIDNVNRWHVDLFYWLLAVLSGLNFLGFVLVANLYKYKKARSPMTEMISSTRSDLCTASATPATPSSDTALIDKSKFTAHDHQARASVSPS